MCAELEISDCAICYMYTRCQILTSARSITNVENVNKGYFDSKENMSVDKMDNLEHGNIKMFIALNLSVLSLSQFMLS